MTIGEKIQRLRNEQQLSQKELAAKLGVSTGLIAEFEADESLPSIAQLRKLSEVLHDVTESLLNGVEERQSCTTSFKNVKYAPKNRWNFGKIALAICTPVLVVAVLVGGYFGWKHYNVTPFSKDTEAISKAEESVVKLVCYDYYGEEIQSGSGFVMFNDSTIVTNFHVLEGAYSCTVFTGENTPLKMHKILVYSEEQDIAVLEMDKPSGLAPLQAGQSSLIQKGETVLAIGSPLGINNAVSTGILSGRTEELSMDMLQFTAAISAGSSGGALFNDAGQVIGVTTAAYEDGQNLNLAIPVEAVVNLYQKGGKSTTVAKLYNANYAHLRYLKKYSHAIYVTCDELLGNLADYAEETVAVYGYIGNYDFGDSFCLYGQVLDYGRENYWSYEDCLRVDLEDADYRDLLLHNKAAVCVIGRVTGTEYPYIKGHVVFVTQPA